MNMWVLLARQGPPIEVELWTNPPIPPPRPSPSPTSFPFLLGYGMDEDSPECRAGNTVGIHPAGCEEDLS